MKSIMHLSMVVLMSIKDCRLYCKSVHLPPFPPQNNMDRGSLLLAASFCGQIGLLCVNAIWSQVFLYKLRYNLDFGHPTIAFSQPLLSSPSPFFHVRGSVAKEATLSEYSVSLSFCFVKKFLCFFFP